MLDQAEDYYWVMAARRRLIVISDAGRPFALCTFFVLKSEAEVPRFYSRTLWSVPEDAEHGPVIYVDKLVGRAWNRTIFRLVEEAITTRVPGWELAVWHRPGRDSDRCYTYHRERRLHADVYR